MIFAVQGKERKPQKIGMKKREKKSTKGAKDTMGNRGKKI